MARPRCDDLSHTVRTKRDECLECKYASDRATRLERRRKRGHLSRDQASVSMSILNGLGKPSGPSEPRLHRFHPPSYRGAA